MRGRQARIQGWGDWVYGREAIRHRKGVAGRGTLGGETRGGGDRFDNGSKWMVWGEVEDDPEMDEHLNKHLISNY